VSAQLLCAVLDIADGGYSLSRWWYARDVRTGREGVVPSAYVE
jgi:hypothetical protein